jgi:hypothetical protein
MTDRLRAIFSSISTLVMAGLLAFLCTSKFARAEGGNTPTAQQATANPALPSNAPNPNSNAPAAPQVADKLVVLPKFEVNGLRERLDAREKIIEKQDTQFWAGFMRLDNGVLIDSILFLCKYKAAHPNELVRLVIIQTNHLGMEGRHDGFGDIVSSVKLDCFLVYTSGDELHARDVRYGDRVYPDFKARQIRTLSDERLFRGTNEFLESTHGFAPVNAADVFHYNRSIHDHEVPGSVAGDDPNLQVRYAEAKLKEVGMTAFVVPATESTGPNNDLMLMFCANHVFYVWRPYFGAYRLSKDTYAKFGIREVADANAK